MKEDLDIESKVDELSKARDKLYVRKAQGSEDILHDLIKKFKISPFNPLQETLCLCWKEGTIPQDLIDSKITTLYKNKGDGSDCDKYTGISLLNIVDKVFPRVALTRLQALAY